MKFFSSHLGGFSDITPKNIFDKTPGFFRKKITEPQIRKELWNLKGSQPPMDSMGFS